MDLNFFIYFDYDRFDVKLIHQVPKNSSNDEKNTSGILLEGIRMKGKGI